MNGRGLGSRCGIYGIGCGNRAVCRLQNDLCPQLRKCDLFLAGCFVRIIRTAVGSEAAVSSASVPIARTFLLAVVAVIFVTVSFFCVTVLLFCGNVRLCTLFRCGSVAFCLWSRVFTLVVILSMLIVSVVTVAAVAGCGTAVAAVGLFTYRLLILICHGIILSIGASALCDRPL